MEKDMRNTEPVEAETSTGDAADTAATAPETETSNSAAEPAPAKKVTSRVAEKPKKDIPVGDMVAKTRTAIARVIWIVCVIAALSLAIGALLIVLDANEGNSLVDFVLNLADAADLGIFGREAGEGIKSFTGQDAETKNVLVNWGIGALVWLIVGRIVERIVRP